MGRGSTNSTEVSERTAGIAGVNSLGNLSQRSCFRPFFCGRTPVTALRALMRSRFFRFQDRASYKTSEVAALFLIGVVLSGLFVLFCAAVDYVMRTVFGPSA